MKKLKVDKIFSGVYEKDVIKNTKWPVDVSYNDKVIGEMEQDGIIKIFNDKMWNVLKDSINYPIYVSSRSSASIDDTNIVKAEKIEDMSITIPNNDFSINEVVKLPLNEIGIIIDIITEHITWHPYRVKIIHGDIFNTIGVVHYFKKEDLKKCDLSKLL